VQAGADSIGPDSIILEPRGDGRFFVGGVMAFETVAAWLERSAELFERAPELRLDLSGITRADSAGLALLLEWVRCARQAGTPLKLANVPPRLRSLIEVTDLDQVLPLVS
jgi:phospholipid transport system transporter-binding protein